MACLSVASPLIRFRQEAHTLRATLMAQGSSTCAEMYTAASTIGCRTCLAVVLRYAIEWKL